MSQLPAYGRCSVPLCIDEHTGFPSDRPLSYSKDLLIAAWPMVWVELRHLGAVPIGPFPGRPQRSTQIPRRPISIGVDESPGTVGEVLTASGTTSEVVPGVPRCLACMSPAPGWQCSRPSPSALP
eukprot:365768-Chlamydomonas_euryale.AAC.9